MKIRRYYDSSKRYGHVWFPELEDQEAFIAQMGKLGYSAEQALDIDTAEQEIILNPDEEEEWFFDSLKRVYDNPRFYLDRLESLPTFRVNVTKIFPEPIPMNKVRRKQQLYKQRGAQRDSIEQ